MGIKVKEFVDVLLRANCSDRLIIYDGEIGGKEVYYGYVDEKQVDKDLENALISDMWVGINNICIVI